VVRRVPRASSSHGGFEKPLTEEEWWRSAGAADRESWLTAHFVESGGPFEIVKASQDPCANCDGLGLFRDGRLCDRCNGCGLVRVVEYR